MAEDLRRQENLVEYRQVAGGEGEYLTYPSQAYPESSTHSQPQPSLRPSKQHMAAIVVTAIIFVSLLFQSLSLRQADQEIAVSLETINQEIHLLNEQNRQLRIQIADQYDYEQIKQVAQEQGMEIDGSRVRNVGE